MDLGLHPYKFQLIQELKMVDHRLRWGFCCWILEQLVADPSLHQSRNAGFEANMKNMQGP